MKKINEFETKTENCLLNIEDQPKSYIIYYISGSCNCMMLPIKLFEKYTCVWYCGMRFAIVCESKHYTGNDKRINNQIDSRLMKLNDQN